MFWQDAVFGEQKKRFFKYCFMCCFPSNPVELVARIPAGGYVPGQTIHVEICLNNQSYKQITQLKLELVRVWEMLELYISLQVRRLMRLFTFQVQTFHIKDYKRASEMQNQTIIQQTTDCGPENEEIIHTSFKVPKVPPTETISNIIKTNYEIRVSKNCDNSFYIFKIKNCLSVSPLWIFQTDIWSGEWLAH